MKSLLTRREVLLGLGLSSAAVVVAACQPKVVEVERVVRETVVVEKEVETIVEKEVERVVEKEKIVKETVAIPVERSKVVFWHIFGSGANRDVFDQVIGDFNAESAAYVVEPVFTDFWTYEQKLLATIAAGNPPDVIMGDMTRAGQRAEAKQILPLDEYVAADNLDLSLFVEYGVGDVNYKGQTWGIPFGPDTRILYYNKAAFEEAGLDPNTPPERWDDLWEYALKLDKFDDRGNVQRVGFCPIWGNVWFLPFIWSNGAVLVDEASNFYFNSPEVIETAAWYRKWVDHYGHEELTNFASGFGSDANDPFMSEQVAMIVQTNGYIGNLRRFVPDMQWGTGLIPHNGTPASWGAGFDLEIPAGAKSPDGAWEFIKFLVSEEVSLLWAKVSGWFPGRMDVAQDPELAQIPGWETVMESMKVTQSRSFVLEAPTWYGFLTTAMQEVWDGVKEPEQALSDAQAEVEQEVQNYRATRG